MSSHYYGSVYDIGKGTRGGKKKGAHRKGGKKGGSHRKGTHKAAAHHKNPAHSTTCGRNAGNPRATTGKRSRCAGPGINA